jgi:putative transposase
VPRIARIVVPDHPHHATQRGARRQLTFFKESDYARYLDLLAQNRSKTGAEIWAYCLMPNHVHMVIVPKSADGLARLLSNTHHCYARIVNAEHQWQGHLWQERFHSVVMDEEHLLAAVRYIELNPVRAGLCRQATEWRWSSVHAHLRTRPDPIVTTKPMLDRISDWQSYLAERETQDLSKSLREHTNTGWPAGSAEFIDMLERLTHRRLRPGNKGRPPA